VYEVTDLSSFNAIKQWVEEISANADKQVNKILIGNKCDVDDSMRAVTRAQGEQLAKEYGMAFFETSAKKDIGVADAFSSIARQVVLRLSKDGGGGPRGGAGAGAGGGAGAVRVEAKTEAKKSGGWC